MAKNEFKVTSIFKIIIRIDKKIFYFCRKTSKFLSKRYLFIFCIFYLNKQELVQQVCLKKYTESEIFNYTFHKRTNQKKMSKNIIQVHNYHF